MAFQWGELHIVGRQNFCPWAIDKADVSALTLFSPSHRYQGADPKASSLCPRPGPREETVNPHEPSQHHPQVPYQQPSVPAAIPGAHHPPAGAALLQEAGGLGQAAARWDQPKGPQLTGEHLTAGNKTARISTWGGGE